MTGNSKFADIGNRATHVCSENKGADQLHGYLTADLHLVFTNANSRFSHDAAPISLVFKSLKILWIDQQV